MNKNARHKQGVYFCNTVGKTVLQLHAMKVGSYLHAHVFIMGFDNTLSTHQKETAQQWAQANSSRKKFVQHNATCNFVKDDYESWLMILF